MKFTASVLLLAPFLAQLASARPLFNEDTRSLKQRANNNNNRFGQGRFGQQQQKTTAKAATTSAKAAATTTAKATAATTTAKGAKGVTTTAAAAASTSVAAASSTTAAAAASTSVSAGTGTADVSTGGSTGAAASTEDNKDPQQSLTLLTSLIGPNLANNGQNPPVAGQVASLTSTNNFINYCVGQTITNGEQNVAGSCNPVPMGQIPAKTAMPSCKFVFPPNGGTVAANQNFTIQLAIKNMQTGAFTNANQNYFAAPQQLNGSGQIVGHSHVVIESLPSLGSTTPTDPATFVFFKGLNNPADGNGILSTVVTGGLPAGTYKVTSINTSANHVPVIVPVAQHGTTEDVSYFTSK
ncbi:hypothetical protein FRB95_003966 [Tulasnella sp. JGI-2019a]|nr:hypothetical protein FRB95_003966 [Tulasnella sp. JGI-2019a]